eukprot:g10230.t1
MSSLRVCLRASATVSQIACRQPAFCSALLPCRGFANQALKMKYIPPLFVTTLQGEEMEGQKWMSPKTKQHLDKLQAEHKEAVSKIAKTELHRVLRAHRIKISPDLECDLKTWKTAVRSHSPHFPTTYSFANALGGEMEAQKWMSQKTKDSLSKASAEYKEGVSKISKTALQNLLEAHGIKTTPDLLHDFKTWKTVPTNWPGPFVFSVSSAVRESTQLDRDLAFYFPALFSLRVYHIKAEHPLDTACVSSNFYDLFTLLWIFIVIHASKVAALAALILS